MIKYIVASPIYDHLKYPSNEMNQRVEDAHKRGRLLKLVIGPYDLKELSDPYVFLKGDHWNFKFPVNQFHAADIVIFVDYPNHIIIKGSDLC